MNVLILAKLDEKDRYVLDLAAKLLNPDDKVFLLNVVRVSGDVPLKPNGEVLDRCTEFDLSGYWTEQRTHLDKLQQYTLPGIERTAMVKVGNAFQIIKDVINTQSIGLMMSAAHVSTVIEDVFSATFADRLMHETTIPYITLKCDRAQADYQHFGLVNPFKEIKKENLEHLLALRQKFGAKLTLFKVMGPSEHRSKAEITQQMEAYCQLNNLTDVQFEFVEVPNNSRGIDELVRQRGVDMLAMCHTRHYGLGSYVRGEMTSDVLNHVLIPIYIY